MPPLAYPRPQRLRYALFEFVLGSPDYSLHPGVSIKSATKQWWVSHGDILLFTTQWGRWRTRAA